MKGIHDKVKQLAQRKQGVSLNELKPNPREVAQRLISQGTLFNIGGNRFKWGESAAVTNDMILTGQSSKSAD